MEKDILIIIYSYNWKNVTPGTVIFDNGLNKVAYLSTDKCYSNSSTREYDLSGCNQNYNVSNVKHIVDNWIFNTISVEDVSEDENGYNARLINADDLIVLGFVSIQANTSGEENLKAGNDTPEFIINDNTRGMLTMIPSYTYTYNNGTEILYGMTIADDGYSFIAESIPTGAVGTVRPVVTLNKKEIEKKITNVEEIDDTVSEDNKSNNIEVDIVSNVDNTTNVNTNNVVVPNTLSSKNIIIIFIGLTVLVAGFITFIYFKKK